MFKETVPVTDAAARVRTKPHIQRMNMLPEGWMWETTIGGMRYVAWQIRALSAMAQSTGERQQGSSPDEPRER
jgi:hypothetical protein